MARESKFKRFLRNAKEEYDNEYEIARSFNHSLFYHKYFEGYIENCDDTDESKIFKKIRRKYTGSYYMRKCRDSALTGTKIKYLILYFISVSFFIYAVSRPSSLNMTMEGAFFDGVTVLFLLPMMVRIFCCLFSKRKMTIYEFGSSFGGLKKGALFCFFSMSLSFITRLYKMIIIRDFCPESVTVTSFGLMAAAAMLFIIISEARAIYAEIENEEKSSDGQIVIG